MRWAVGNDCVFFCVSSGPREYCWIYEKLLMRSRTVGSTSSINSPRSEIESGLDLLVVGWQERVALPEFSLEGVACKLDSGAAISSLHVQSLRYVRRAGWDWVQFEIGTEFGLLDSLMLCESRLSGMKRIQSSSGHLTVRPVVETMLSLGGFHWPVELTLTCRKQMQFPLLVGRNALEGRCLIDCGRTFLASR